jgi:uncharacterized protein (TIGR02996 family)
MEAALFAQIAAAPDDRAAYLVLADALQHAGDPRGELIALQIALEDADGAAALALERRIDELFAEHDRAWTGAIVPEVRPRLVVAWRRGFVHAARVTLDGDPHATLDALLAMPHVHATLGDLALGPTPGAEYWPNCQGLITTLCERWPRALRRLAIYDGDVRAVWRAAPVELGPLARADSLEELIVYGRVLRPIRWTAAPPRLRRLELPLADARLDDLTAIATWPHLETLVLWGAEPGELAPLTPARFPALRELGLVGTRRTDALAAALVELPIAAQLERVDLSGGTLTPVGSRVVRRLPKDCAIDLSRNLLPKSEASALAALGWAVRPQRRGKQPWLDAIELERLAVRIADESAAIHEALRWANSPGRVRNVADRFAQIVELAELCDPAWAYPARVQFSRALASPQRAGAMRAIAETLLAEVRAEASLGLYKELGEDCAARGELDDAEHWHRERGRRARWLGERRHETEAFEAAAMLCVDRGVPDVAAPMFARAAAFYAGANDRPREAQAMRRQGSVELLRSNFARAEKFYRGAIAIYAKAGGDGDVAIVMSELAGVLWSRQDYGGAEEMLRDAAASCAPGSLALASTLCNLAVILNNDSSRASAARAAANQARELFRKHGNRQGEVQVLNLLGEIAQQRLDADEATRQIDLAVSLAREHGYLRDLGVALSIRARIALDTGDYPLAHACCDEAGELHRAGGNKYNEGLQLLSLSDAALAEGDDASAAEHAAEALVPLEAIAALPAMAAVRIRFGQLAQRVGDRPGAEAHYRAAIADAERGKRDESIAYGELWLATVVGGDEAAALLGSARGRIAAANLAGREAVAACEAVVAGQPPSLARSFGARLFELICE